MKVLTVLTLGTRRLIAGLALVAAGLCVWGYITGAEWIGFVGGLMGMHA